MGNEISEKVSSLVDELKSSQPSTPETERAQMPDDEESAEETAETSENIDEDADNSSPKLPVKILSIAVDEDNIDQLQENQVPVKVSLSIGDPDDAGGEKPPTPMPEGFCRNLNTGTSRTANDDVECTCADLSDTSETHFDTMLPTRYAQFSENEDEEACTHVPDDGSCTSETVELNFDDNAAVDGNESAADDHEQRDKTAPLACDACSTDGDTARRVDGGANGRHSDYSQSIADTSSDSECDGQTAGKDDFAAEKKRPVRDGARGSSEPNSFSSGGGETPPNCAQHDYQRHSSSDDLCVACADDCSGRPVQEHTATGTLHTECSEHESSRTNDAHNGADHPSGKWDACTTVHSSKCTCSKTMQSTCCAVANGTTSTYTACDIGCTNTIHSSSIAAAARSSYCDICCQNCGFGATVTSDAHTATNTLQSECSHSTCAATWCGNNGADTMQSSYRASVCCAANESCVCTTQLCQHGATGTDTMQSTCSGCTNCAPSQRGYDGIVQSSSRCHFGTVQSGTGESNIGCPCCGGHANYSTTSSSHQNIAHQDTDTIGSTYTRLSDSSGRNDRCCCDMCSEMGTLQSQANGCCTLSSGFSASTLRSNSFECLTVTRPQNDGTQTTRSSNTDKFHSKCSCVSNDASSQNSTRDGCLVCMDTETIRSKVAYTSTVGSTYSEEYGCFNGSNSQTVRSTYSDGGTVYSGKPDPIRSHESDVIDSREDAMKPVRPCSTNSTNLDDTFDICSCLNQHLIQIQLC